MNPSLRTEKDEIRYQNAKKKKIETLPHNRLNGLKIAENEFPYTIAHDKCDMIIGGDDFWDFWIRTGQLIHEGRLNYDQFIYNFPKRQSQPHIAHGHLVNYKDDRKEFCL